MHHQGDKTARHFYIFFFNFAAGLSQSQGCKHQLGLQVFGAGLCLCPPDGFLHWLWGAPVQTKQQLPSSLLGQKRKPHTVNEITPKAKTSLMNRSTKKKTASMTALRDAFANYGRAERLLPVPSAGTTASEKRIYKCCILEKIYMVSWSAISRVIK